MFLCNFQHDRIWLVSRWLPISPCSFIGDTDNHRAGSDANHVRYAALFLILPGTYCGTPPLVTWIPNNTAPYTSRETGAALQGQTTNLGSLLAVWLLGSLSAAPAYRSATITLLVFQLGILGCAVGNIMYLMEENRKKKRVRDQEGARGEDAASLGDNSAWFVYKL